MNIPILTTDRLRLRPFHEDDAAVVRALAGRPEVALTTLTIPYPYGEGVAEAWIATHGPAWDECRSLSLAVTESEQVVGAIGLSLNAPNRRGEIGYWIGVPYWNRGYATEAAWALLVYGFTELGLNRIQARYLIRNPASGRVMAKLGMRAEGIQRQYFIVRGVPEDIGMYASLKTDRADWATGSP